MIDWTYIQANFDWLGHIVEALCIAAVVGLFFCLVFERRIAVLMGIAFAAGHFHGREKRDYEVSVHMAPPHLDAYKMWRWSFDQMTDFWPTAIVCFLLAVAIYRWQRRQG